MAKEIVLEWAVLVKWQNSVAQTRMALIAPAKCATVPVRDSPSSAAFRQAPKSLTVRHLVPLRLRHRATARYKSARIKKISAVRCFILVEECVTHKAFVWKLELAMFAFPPNAQRACLNAAAVIVPVTLVSESRIALCRLALLGQSQKARQPPLYRHRRQRQFRRFHATVSPVLWVRSSIVHRCL